MYIIRFAFTFAAVLSAALLVATLATWAYAISNDSSISQIRPAPNCYLGVVCRRGLDTRMAFFNDPDGPYRGSIIALAGGPMPDRQTEFGDTAGVYYRYFHWVDGGELWTLSFSLAYPIIAFSVLPSYWLTRKIRVRHQRSRPNAAMDL